MFSLQKCVLVALFVIFLTLLFTGFLLARHTHVESLTSNADDNSQYVVCCSNKIVVRLVVNLGPIVYLPSRNMEWNGRVHVVAPRSWVAFSVTSSATSN